jgi:carboxyvinyl-carboxyphosphonate phosphorylmutase
MHWTKRRQRFRTILGGDACVHPASVYDPISARIAEDLGFELGMYAGSTASLTVLGAPDLVVVTLSEFAAQALRIARAGTLPFLVDADHGYGNALSVMRTVEELEVAGVAGVCIEDTKLPAGFGDGGKAQLISLEEGVGKMRAALAAREDPSLVIVGRTGAAAITGIADAVRRIAAYEAEGVDAVFLTGISSHAQIEEAAAAVKCPIIIGTLKPALADRAWLAAHGVRVCLQGHLPIMAATKAVYETMKALREGTSPDALTGLASSELMKRVTRDDRYSKWTKAFLGG